MLFHLIYYFLFCNIKTIDCRHKNYCLHEKFMKLHAVLAFLPSTPSIHPDMPPPNIIRAVRFQRPCRFGCEIPAQVFGAVYSIETERYYSSLRTLRSLRWTKSRTAKDVGNGLRPGTVYDQVLPGQVRFGVSGKES
jgi:hypothetical protein